MTTRLTPGPGPAAPGEQAPAEHAPAEHAPEEQQRLAAVAALELLDTPAEERFDRVTRLCQRLFDVPMAAVTLVDRDQTFLIAGLETVRQAGGDLRIAGAGEQVQMVLELTQMHTVLRPYPSVEAALDVG